VAIHARIIEQEEHAVNDIAHRRQPETRSLAEWARLLPRQTLVLSDPNTVLSIREIAALLRDCCPTWTFQEVTGGR
jgi:hypothetical protein